MLLWFEKNYDVNLTLSNLANFLKTDLKIVQLGELLSDCRRIFELRPNFLKHSQNSHSNYKYPALIHSTCVAAVTVFFKQILPKVDFFCQCSRITVLTSFLPSKLIKKSELGLA
jgi:hypothetical protein